MRAFGVELDPLHRPSVAEVLEHVASVVALGTLAVVLAADAGRDTRVMVWVVVAVLPAVAFTRPWRHVPTWLLWLFALLPASAVAVSYLTPTGFAYSRDLIVWAYAAELGVVTAAYARTLARRAAVVLFVSLLGFYDFFQGFVPWRSGGDPARAMVGTFYQQDMFGAFCVAVALAAAALAVLAPAPWRLVGLVVAPFGAAGGVLSTSRAAQGLLALGALALVGLAASGPSRWRRLGPGAWS